MGFRACGSQLCSDFPNKFFLQTHHFGALSSSSSSSSSNNSNNSSSSSSSSSSIPSGCSLSSCPFPFPTLNALFSVPDSNRSTGYLCLCILPMRRSLINGQLGPGALGPGPISVPDSAALLPISCPERDLRNPHGLLHLDYFFWRPHKASQGLKMPQVC